MLVRLVPYDYYLAIKRVWNFARGGYLPVRGRDGLVFVVGHGVLRSWIKRGTYEEDELRRLLPHLREGVDVMEVGGGMGVLSCYIAAAVGPTGRLVVMEPDLDNRRFLTANLRRNHLLERTTVIECALGYEPTIQLRYGDTLSNTFIEQAPQRKRTVKCMTVRDVARLCGVRPDVLVVDAEGMESRLFADESDFLRERRPIIVAEVHPGLLGRSSDEIVRPLRDVGYNVTLYPTNGLRAVIEAVPSAKLLRGDSIPVLGAPRLRLARG